MEIFLDLVYPFISMMRKEISNVTSRLLKKNTCRVTPALSFAAASESWEISDQREMKFPIFDQITTWVADLSVFLGVYDMYALIRCENFMEMLQRQ